MKNFKLILIVLMGVIFLVSCKSDNGEITKIPGINDFTENNPSATNALNSLTINVAANKYNQVLEYQINFDRPNVTIALSISGISGGDVSIQIYNNPKQMLYNANFNQNTSYSQLFSLDDTPTKVKFIFNTLTANFNCAISGK